MPIHPAILAPRPAEGGKIKIGRLGAPRRTQDGDREYRQPERLNHFIITKTVRTGQDENFVEDEALMEMLKEHCDSDRKLRKIPIVLDSDLIEEIFPSSLACYAGRSLHCRGTGEPGSKATRFEIKDGRQTGKTKQVPCACDYLGAPASSRLQCKPHGTLWCTIVAGEETRLGVRHAFRTTSWHSIRGIQAGLEQIRRAVGTICGIPLLLVVGPTLSRTREGGTRQVVAVHVELRTKDLMAVQRHAIELGKSRREVIALASNPQRLGLAAPAGEQETAAEQALVQQEWHPTIEPDDNGEEGEEGEPRHDAVTGEVFDVPFTERHDAESQSQAKAGGEAKAQPKPGADRLNSAGTPAHGASTTARSAGAAEPVLADDDPLREQIKRALTQLAELRGASPEQMSSARKVILEEVTLSECGKPIVWRALTASTAYKVHSALGLMILKRRKEEEGEERAVESEARRLAEQQEADASAVAAPGDDASSQSLSGDDAIPE